MSTAVDWSIKTKNDQYQSNQRHSSQAFNELIDVANNPKPHDNRI